MKKLFVGFLVVCFVQFLNTAWCADGDPAIMGKTNTGDFTVQSTTDSATAVQVLDADGGAPVLNVDTDGENVGVGTAGPDRKLDVLDASDPQLRLTHTDGSVYSEMQTDSNGDLTITPSGGDVDIDANVTATSFTADPSDPATMSFVNSSGADGDTNAMISVTLSDSGSGTEDADVTFSSQVDGTMFDFMVWDASDESLVLPLENDSATPTMAFGDGDTGFYESADDTLAFAGDGNVAAYFNRYYMRGTGEGRFRLDFGVSAYNDPLYCFRADDDTGIGRAAADQLSLIAGGVEGIRLIESTGVLQKVQLTTGITATNPGVQGDNPLVSSYNRITTVGTADDAVTLPAADSGVICNIRNDGANQLEVWPASGDDCGSGVDTACTIAAGDAVTYVAIDATTWKIW